MSAASVPRLTESDRAARSPETAAGAITCQRNAGIFGDTVSQPVGTTAANLQQLPAGPPWGSDQGRDGKTPRRAMMKLSAR